MDGDRLSMLVGFLAALAALVLLVWLSAWGLALVRAESHRDAGFGPKAIFANNLTPFGGGTATVIGTR